MKSSVMKSALCTLSKTVFRSIDFDEIRLNRFSIVAAKRLRREQLRGTIKQMRVFMIGNSVFIPVFGFQAWGAGVDILVALWTAIMLGYTCWSFVRWEKTYQTDGHINDMNSFVVEIGVASLIWSIGFMMFFPVTEGDSRTVMLTLIGGCIALGAFGNSQSPRAAFWYLGIQTVGVTGCLLVYAANHGAPTYAMLGAVVFFASVAVANAILERAREQVRAFINVEDLSQKSEVIDLLLKEYEEQGVDWLWQTDRDGILVSGPRQVLDLIGLDSTNLGTGNLVIAMEAMIEPRGGQDLERVRAAFYNRIDFHDVMLPFHDHNQNGLKWIMMRGRPQFDGDTFTGFRGIFADATKIVEAQKKIEFLADRDPLTGAYNRNSLQRRLTELDPDTERAVAFLIDLDGFKQVNDSYGHTIGDELLQEVTERLNACTNGSNIVARLGGDEFIVVMDSAKTGNDFSTQAFAHSILNALNYPFYVQRYEIVVSASIGTATFPDDTRTGAELMSRADLALFEAKRNGKNQWVPFVEEMHARLMNRIDLTERLKNAIQNKEIRPFYQPQHCARTGELLGVEALARWTDSELGPIGPDVFIPIAEETGLIHELGEQLLYAACEDAIVWARNSDSPTPIVSVNLSPAQVTRGNVVELIQRVLADTTLPATCLEVEITEGVLIHDIEATCGVLRELSSLGVKIALDDFGTGYSSLSYIRALPLDRLKIDRSFVADLGNPSSHPIVQTIIELCETLGLSVVVEGVETAEHVRILRAMRCDVLQGYYYSPAVPADQIVEMFRLRTASVNDRALRRLR